MTSQVRSEYMPANTFLDSLLAHLHLKNDAALSRTIKIAPPQISKIRHRALSVSAAVILAAHERADVPVALMRSWLKNEESLISN